MSGSPRLSASIVLYKTPRSQIDSVLKSVFDSKCVSLLYKSTTRRTTDGAFWKTKATRRRKSATSTTRT